MVSEEWSFIWHPASLPSMNLKGQTQGLEKPPYKLNGNNFVNKVPPTVLDVESLNICTYGKGNAPINPYEVG